jgi:hypothetical protein
VVATYQWPDTADVYEREPYIVRFRASNYGLYEYQPDADLNKCCRIADFAVSDRKMLCHDHGTDKLICGVTRWLSLYCKF